MLKIQGTLRTLSPLTINQPGELKISLAGRRSPQGFPCSQVATWSLPATEELAGTVTPVIPANTLRGGLRRAGAALVERALMARGEKLELAALHSLRSGTPYGHPDKASPNLSEIAAAQQTPALGLMGGGPRMIGGAVRVDYGVPVTAATVDRGLVPLRLADAKVDGRLTAYFWLRRADDVVTFVDHQLAQHVVKDYPEALDAWQVLVGQVSDEQVDEDAPDEGTFRKVAGLNAFEAVLPGITFALRYDLDTDHAANAGYLLLSLLEFANAQRLGGMGRLGHGRFAIDLSAELPDGSTTPVFSRTDAGYSLDLSNPLLAKMVEEAKAWLDQVTAAQLHTLLLPSTSSREDVRKKLKGNAKMQEAFDLIYGTAG